jgi:hypothetical protein
MQTLESAETTKRQSKRISMRMWIQIHTKEIDNKLMPDTTGNTDKLFPSFSLIYSPSRRTTFNQYRPLTSLLEFQ